VYGLAGFSGASDKLCSELQTGLDSSSRNRTDIRWALGVLAQGLLTIGVIGYAMPWLSLGVLDMARDVAAFNLPARVGQLFGVSL
jgi:hypothetical protein